MSCSFKITFPSLASEHLEMAKEAILRHGGSFNIKGNKGTFEIPVGIGKVAGNVVMNGAEVDFNITHKPFLISCGVIEKQVRKYTGLPG